MPLCAIGYSRKYIVGLDFVLVIYVASEFCAVCTGLQLVYFGLLVIIC